MDILVNNASLMPMTSTPQLKSDEIEKIITVNLGSYIMVRDFWWLFPCSTRCIVFWMRIHFSNEIFYFSCYLLCYLFDDVSINGCRQPRNFYQKWFNVNLVMLLQWRLYQVSLHVKILKWLPRLFVNKSNVMGTIRKWMKQLRFAMETHYTEYTAVQ